MDTVTDTTDARAGAPHTAAGPPRRRTRHAGHVIALVVGCLLLVPALGLAVGGGAALVGQAVATDDEGYVRFTPERLRSDGAAITATDLWLDDAGGENATWLLDWLDVDLRLRVSGAEPSEDIFVGIGRAADVTAFLDGVARSEVVDLDRRRPAYDEVAGVTDAPSPLDAPIWAVSAHGSGEQELVWEATGGRWSVVVMNAGGEAGVAADVEIGARSGAITPVATTLIVLGVMLLGGAVALIVIGARGRRTRPDSDATAGDGPTGDAPLPPPHFAAPPSGSSAAVGSTTDASPVDEPPVGERDQAGAHLASPVG